MPLTVKRLAPRLAAAAVWLSILACRATGAHPAPEATHQPVMTPVMVGTAAQPSPVPTPTPTVAAVKGAWTPLAPGLEIRRDPIPNEVFDDSEALILRIDPAQYTFRATYSQLNPRRLSGWEVWTGASVVSNAGFFETDSTPVGMVIVDGERYGMSLSGHGGMLASKDGVISLRSLAQTPFRPGEEFDYAVQGRPMLLDPGGVPVNFDLSAELSRRTAVAIDSEGRLMIVVVNDLAVSLYELRDWMRYHPDIDFYAAFNLDGGGSTSIAINVGDTDLLIDSWWPLPGAMAFYPKG
jgi:uncharacterized protein YigE (DUF2233 family)